jgi:hypothetical protein
MCSTLRDKAHPAPAKRQTPNAKRQTPNAKRQTPNAKRQTPNALTLPVDDLKLSPFLEDDPQRRIDE